MIGLRNYHAVTNSVLPIVIEELDIFTTNNISIFANRVACGTYDPPIEINKDPFDDKSLHRDIRNHNAAHFIKLSGNLLKNDSY